MLAGIFFPQAVTAVIHSCEQLVEKKPFSF
jgi:hypothetical protein